MTMLDSIRKDIVQRYKVHRDTHGTWRILDVGHKDLRGYTEDDDISDDHPALTIINDGQFTAIFQEAMKLGFDMERFMRMHEMGDMMNEANNDLGTHLNDSRSMKDYMEDEHSGGVEIIPVVEETQRLTPRLLVDGQDYEDSEKNENTQLALSKLSIIDKIISNQNYEPESIEKLMNGILRIGGNSDVK